jgi:ribose transport system substrate-binding protein
MEERDVKVFRWLPSLAALVVAAGLATGCGTAGSSSSDSGDGAAKSDAAASTDFWEGFTEVEPTHPANPAVDTKRFVKSDGKQLRIGYADSSLSNSWRNMAKAETEAAIAQVDGAGAKLVYTNANDAAPKQLGDIDDLIAQKVDALIVSAVDVNAVCPALKKAQDAGIPVIIQEREVHCKDSTVFVSIDMENLAENHMKYIAHRLGDKGEIAIISGLPGAGHSVEAERGYEKELAKHPDVKVVAKEYAKYDPAQARQLASSLLVAHPNIQAFAVISGLMTDGVYQGVKAAGKVDQIKAWTGDDANGWMKLAVSEKLPNITVPYPVAAGSYSVEQAVKVLRGEEVKKVFYVPRWEPPVEFSRNLAKFADPDRPDEWWYTRMDCKYDPFCKKK